MAAAKHALWAGCRGTAHAIFTTRWDVPIELWHRRFVRCCAAVAKQVGVSSLDLWDGGLDLEQANKNTGGNTPSLPHRMGKPCSKGAVQSKNNVGWRWQSLESGRTRSTYKTIAQIMHLEQYEFIRPEALVTRPLDWGVGQTAMSAVATDRKSYADSTKQ